MTIAFQSRMPRRTQGSVAAGPSVPSSAMTGVALRRPGPGPARPADPPGPGPTAPPGTPLAPVPIDAPDRIDPTAPEEGPRCSRRLAVDRLVLDPDLDRLVESAQHDMGSLRAVMDGVETTCILSNACSNNARVAPPRAHASSPSVTECGPWTTSQLRARSSPSAAPIARTCLPSWPCCATTSSGLPRACRPHAHRHPRARLRGHHRGSGPPSGRRAQCRRQRRRNRPPDPSAGPSPWRDPAPQHQPCGSPRRPAPPVWELLSSSGPTSGDAGRRDDGPAHQRQVGDRGPPVLRPPRVCRVPRGLQASPLKTPAPYASAMGVEQGPDRADHPAVSRPRCPGRLRAHTADPAPARCGAHRQAAAEALGITPAEIANSPCSRC